MATLRIHYSKEKGEAEKFTVKILDRYGNPPELSPPHEIAKGKTLKCEVKDENGIGNVDIYPGDAVDTDTSKPLIADLYVDRERLVTFPLDKDDPAMPFSGDVPKCDIEKD